MAGPQQHPHGGSEKKKVTHDLGLVWAQFVRSDEENVRQICAYKEAACISWRIPKIMPRID
jgi:hypothetical protein